METIKPRRNLPLKRVDNSGNVSGLLIKQEFLRGEAYPLLVYYCYRIMGLLGILLGILDVPPLDDTSYNLTKGGIHGQKGIHTGTDQ
jgi:hypothetical protein